MTKKTFLTLASLLAGVLPSSAAITALATYDFNNPTGSAVELTPTTLETNVAATPLSAGGTLGFASTTSTAFTSEGLGLDDGTNDDMAGAIAANQYFSFTISAPPAGPNTGALMLDSLTFDVGGNFRGANDYAIRSSVDGFASDLVFANGAIGSAPVGQSLNLNFPAFSNVPSVEFRIYFDDRKNNGSGSSATYIDNVVVNGMVVPEPSRAVLLALGLGGMFLRRRR